MQQAIPLPRQERPRGTPPSCTITAMNNLSTRAIQRQWPTPAASPQALEAERELGILGKPYYFYVLRAEDSVGLVVFILSEAEGAVWPADARGATPFDSGGWWLGMIHTGPSLDTTARRRCAGGPRRAYTAISDADGPEVA